MIFVQGWIKVPEQELGDIIPAASEMMAETVKEAGCLHYSFAKDLNDAGIVHICERWENEDHLNAHFQTQHMAEFNSAISTINIEGMDVRMYSGEEIRVLMQS